MRFSRISLEFSGPICAAIKGIGSEVSEQAGNFAGELEREAEFFAKASKMSKSDACQDMLAPIAEKWVKLVPSFREWDRAKHFQIIATS